MGHSVQTLDARVHKTVIYVKGTHTRGVPGAPRSTVPKRVSKLGHKKGEPGRAQGSPELRRQR